jgi:hypothetical protein
MKSPHINKPKSTMLTVELTMEQATAMIVKWRKAAGRTMLLV